MHMIYWYVMWVAFNMTLLNYTIQTGSASVHAASVAAIADEIQPV